MDMVIGFALGVLYTGTGIYLCALVGDMRGSRLHGFIDQSIPRGVAVLALWPLALTFAAGHAHARAKRGKQVLL